MPQRALMRSEIEKTVELRYWETPDSLYVAPTHDLPFFRDV